METEPDKRRLEELDARINALKHTQTPKPEAEEHYSMAQQGWRMVTELVSGLLIGVGLGYGLDVLFGTLPIFLVVFTLLGFVAGVNVMIRTSKEIQTEAVAHEAAKQSKEG
jgi:ATP synthase protein I